MARPKKNRTICKLPLNDAFVPVDNKTTEEIIEMTAYEYETIRIIDYLGCNQQECAQMMGVARTTVQSDYNLARKKIADFLVLGKKLVISGGDYKICNSDNKHCKCKQCVKTE